MNEITNITETVGVAWVTPAYDSNGNMTTMPGTVRPDLHRTVTYDAWNRIVKIQASNDKRLIECEYDGLDRRIIRRNYNRQTDALIETRHFYYSDSWQCLEERVGTASTADKQYVWGTRYIDDLVLRDKGSERLYALQDANWNVVALCDDTGAVKQRFAYTPYGESEELDPDFTAYTGTDYEWEYRFTGRRLDEETGLYQYRYRYYHAQMGRFVTRDPIGYRGGLNLYAYVGGMPAVASDPMGLQWFPGKGLPPMANPTPKPVAIGPYIPGRMIISPRPRVKPSTEFSTELSSNLNFNYAAKFKLFLDAEGCPKCIELGVVQITRTRGAVQYQPYFGIINAVPQFALGFGYNYWHLDESIPYPYSDVINPSKQLGALPHSDWGIFNDDPGVKPKAGLSPIEWLEQKFEFHFVCLKGKEKGSTYGGYEWSHYFELKDTYDSFWDDLDPSQYKVRRYIFPKNTPSADFKRIVKIP